MGEKVIANLGVYLAPSPALTIPLPALIIPFPVNKLPNKLSPNYRLTYLKILLFVL